jgi:hypothetical protein
VTANWTEEFCPIDAALPTVDLNKSVTPTMKPTTNFQPKELSVIQAAIPSIGLSRSVARHHFPINVEPLDALNR